MEAAAEQIGLREAKNTFSALTSRVNRFGQPVVVLKQGKPWVMIVPADAEAKERLDRLQRLRALTRAIESSEEPPWDEGKSDKDLLNEERVRRFG